jgi:cation diffusion facilitator family transporter
MRSADRRVARVLAVVLFVSVALAICKITFGHLTGLLAIEADGYHSMSDGLTTIVAMIGLVLARRPPDLGHPYGHHKFEVVAACGIGVSLLIGAFMIVEHAIAHVALGSHGAGHVDFLVVAMLVLTFVINLAVAAYEDHWGRRLRSVLLSTDARHARADAWVTAGVIVSTVATALGVSAIDVIAATVVSLLIAKSGLEILIKNGRYLVDAALVDPEQIARIAVQVPNVLGAHTIRSRGTPGAVFLDLRLVVPADLRAADVHELTQQVEHALRAEIDTLADVTMYPQPSTKENNHVYASL